MKLLVAGGAGFVGSALVPVLQHRGYDVEVVDLLWFGNHLPASTKVIRKDIFEIQASDLRGVSQVLFLAGLSNDPMAEYSPGRNFISNAAAPAYLAYVAKQAGVRRFIHAGSCSVYGYSVDSLCDEEAQPTSSYPYGISKLQGERAVMQMVSDDFSVISFRKGTVCGYSPRMRLDLVVNTMFKTAMVDGLITVNNPTIWRPVLSIRDAVSAYVLAVEANPSISGIFNISSGNFTVGEIASLVSEYLASRQIPARIEINHREDYRSYKVDIEKAKNVLSFKPKHDVESIVLDLLDNVPKFDDFDNRNYYNIEVLKAQDETCASKS